MEILCGGRRSGKTARLLSWTREHPDALLVVHDWREAERLLKENEWLRSERIRTHESVRHDTLEGLQVRIGLDNLDLLFGRLFGQQPELVTMTGELHFEELPPPRP